MTDQVHAGDGPYYGECKKRLPGGDFAEWCIMRRGSVGQGTMVGTFRGSRTQMIGIVSVLNELEY